MDSNFMKIPMFIEKISYIINKIAYLLTKIDLLGLYITGLS